MSSLRAFGGGPLLGDFPLRFAHLDEAGTSRDERHCVVAGVVSHADRQWKALNTHLADLADEFAPVGGRDGLIFHAKDIFHGSKKFHRDDWPHARRKALLERLAAVPDDFSLPIVSGIVDKEAQSWDGVKVRSAAWEACNYGLAFGLCAIHVDYLVRSRCGENELASLVVEDAPNMRRYAKFGYKTLSDPKMDWTLNKITKENLPLSRIVEQPLFSEKGESSILQIADFVAFVFGRKLNGRNDVDPYFNRLRSQLVILPHQRGV